MFPGERRDNFCGNFSVRNNSFLKEEIQERKEEVERVLHMTAHMETVDGTFLIFFMGKLHGRQRVIFSMHIKAKFLYSLQLE